MRHLLTPRQREIVLAVAGVDHRDDDTVAALANRDPDIGESTVPGKSRLRRIDGNHQTLLFSATLDGDVGHLIRHYQTDPVTVAIDEATDTGGTMHHLFLAVHHMDKDKVIGSIGKSIPKVLVFCQTKRVCDRVNRNLQDLGVNADSLHGDMQQKARERD